MRSARRCAHCSLCLTGKVRSGCRGLLGERDVVSEAFELGDEASGLAFGVAVDEVVAAEVAVGLAGGEHVPDRTDHRVFDCAERALVPAARLEPPVLGFEVVALDADRGHGGLLEREVQPLRAVAGLAGAAFAGRLIVGGAAPGPRREVPRGRELRHVGADLADDALRAAALDAGHRAHQLNRRRERADLFLDHAGELLDLLIEESTWRKIAPIHSRWWASKCPASASRRAGIFLRIWRRASSASTSGSVSPATSAWSMSRPGLPRMSAATVSSLMPASSSALWSRLTSRARSWICVLR